jgi:acetolactate decarboxylase
MFETARLGIGKSHHQLASKDVSPHLVLLGPFENFHGEVTIIDGKVFYSSVLQAQPLAQHPAEIKTVFNVRSECQEWRPLNLTHAKDINDLEEQLKSKDVYFFHLKTQIEKSTLHIVNGIDNSVMRPAKKMFHQNNTSLELVGVYSQNHQRVFTHHDRFTHIHAIDLIGFTYHLDEATNIKVISGRVCHVNF